MKDLCSLSHLDGVDHSGDEHGEDDITIEVAPLCYGSRHNGGTGGSKGALKHWTQTSLLADTTQFLLGRRRKRTWWGPDRSERSVSSR